MNYLMNRDNLSYLERVAQINNIDPEKLDVSGFIVDKDIEILNEFTKKLLSFRDKRFFIVGDYDCDGICATSIMYLFLLLFCAISKLCFAKYVLNFSPLRLPFI